MIDTNKGPSEGYSDQEVLKRYSNVSHAVPPNQYAQAAIEALGKLSPETATFMKMLQERAAARGVAMPRQLAPEPKELGQVLTDLHAKPGQLRDILGGGDAQPQGQAQRSNPISDMLASPQAKAVLAGIAATVASASCRVRPEPRSAPRLDQSPSAMLDLSQRNLTLHGHSYAGAPRGDNLSRRSTHAKTVVPEQPFSSSLHPPLPTHKHLLLRQRID